MDFDLNFNALYISNIQKQIQGEVSCVNKQQTIWKEKSGNINKRESPLHRYWVIFYGGGFRSRPLFTHCGRKISALSPAAQNTLKVQKLSRGKGNFRDFHDFGLFSGKFLMSDKKSNEKFAKIILRNIQLLAKVFFIPLKT